MLSISSAEVVEQFIIRADLLIHLVHIILNNRRKSVIIRIARLSCLEEDIRVLSGTSLTGMVGIQSMLTERIDRFHIRHILQIFVIPCLDFLDLM